MKVSREAVDRLATKEETKIALQGKQFDGVKRLKTH